MHTRAAFQRFGMLCILVICTTSNAADLCDAPLLNRSFDTTNRQETTSMALTSRAQVCSADYDNEESAESAGMSAGASGKYGVAKGSASYTRYTGSQRGHLRQSSFCQASNSEMASFYSGSEQKQVASIAVAAWESCIKLTKTSQLFVLFEQQSDKTGVTGTLIRSLSDQGGAIGTVKMINASSRDAKVECFFDTVSVKANEQVVYPITKARTNFSCTKPKDASVKISINTDQGDTKWMQLDSVSDAKAYEENAIQKSIATLQSNYASLSTRASIIETALPEKLSKGEWPTGSYVILKGKSAACPAGFTERRGYLYAINQFHNPANLLAYTAPSEFGDSSIGCHGRCGSSPPHLGDLTIAACVK